MYHLCIPRIMVVGSFRTKEAVPNGQKKKSGNGQKRKFIQNINKKSMYLHLVLQCHFRIFILIVTMMTNDFFKLVFIFCCFKSSTIPRKNLNQKRKGKRKREKSDPGFEQQQFLLYAED